LVAFGILDLVAAWWWWNWRREHRFDPQILAAAQRYRLDPALIKAVIWRESRFIPHARGTVGELGLMQVGDLAAHEWADAEHLPPLSADQMLSPATNILAGTWYLKKLIARYRAADDPVPYALADYNAGRTHSLRWSQGAAATNSAAFIAQIGFPATQNYVKTILRRRAHYAPEFASTSR
jgi:soluble lytic murein transglycosylase